ncbi:MAG: hypothetical protein MJZ74_01265 [Muribaculaceae bacterium]|nr:hypothetical protein [Muribaculaceae bacterium]
MFRYCYIALSLVAIVIAAITVSTFGIADGLSIVAAMAVACAVPLAVARRCCSWWSPTCCVAFAVVALVLVASAVNYIYATTLQQGATLEMPILDCDAGGYYKWALHHYDGRCDEPLITFFGFPMAMLALWRVLGVSIVWPVAMNLMLTATSVIMAASLAVTFTRRIKGITPSATAAITMALLGLHGYFMSQGFVIQKEALNYVSLTMIAMALVWLQDSDTAHRKAIAAVAMYAVACVVLALVRAKYINFAAFGVILLGLSCWRTRWRSLLALVAITGITWYLGMYFSTTYSVEQQVYNVTGGEIMTLAFKGDNYQSMYYGWMDGYFTLPMWKRALYLPFTCGTMAIIPFPWGAESSAWTSVMPRVRIGWYLCAGLMVIYYLMLSWRRKHSLGLVAWWPVICYVGIAYICAGSVSRYTLPFQPLFVAIAVYVIALIRTDNTLRRPLLSAYAVYAIALVTSLVGAIFIIS